MLAHKQPTWSLLAKVILWQAMLLSFFPCVSSGESRLPADKIKVAYLVNFARYIQWPKSAFVNDESPIVIVLNENHRYANKLDGSIAGKTKGGRNIVFRASNNSTNDAHIIFLQDQESNAEKVLKKHNEHVLLVGDTDDFLQKGGMIQLSLENENVVFYLDRDRIVNQGLYIHYKILSIARKKKVNIELNTYE